MPRSNRPRRRREQPGQQDDELDLERMRAGWRRVERRHGVGWNVQPITAAQASKIYVCPGCGGRIEPGTAHLVAWRADGVMGDAADVAARRHWHTQCWRIS